jgi:hypothetical protein
VPLEYKLQEQNASQAEPYLIVADLPSYGEILSVYVERALMVALHLENTPDIAVRPSDLEHVLRLR